MESLKELEICENIESEHNVEGLEIIEEEFNMEKVLIAAQPEQIIDYEEKDDLNTNEKEDVLEEFILGLEEDSQLETESLDVHEESCVITGINSENIDEKIQSSIEKFNNIKCDYKVSVFAKVNKEGFITELISDIFLENHEGWVKIDEGFGDKYIHAQSCYFDNELTDVDGKYRYKASVFQR